MKTDDFYADCEPLAILDSKHIVTTIKDYDIKIVQCGEYVQVYYYDKKRVIRKREDDFDLKLKEEKIKKMFDNDDVEKTSKKDNLKDKNEIAERSIIRSKLECQRLAKSNMRDWKTFITLTFAENETNIDVCNKRFRYFVDKVKRVYKDFKYIAIPEFQKRGAVHYHLLTNIDINNKKLIYEQEDNKKYKHIKYWLDGYTKVDYLEGDTKKVVGYISKYMTKDIDNRLFNRHRYFYSRNLITPKESYINLEKEKDIIFYKKIIQDSNLIYQNEYENIYDNSKVTFLEYISSKTFDS